MCKGREAIVKSAHHVYKTNLIIIVHSKSDRRELELASIIQ